MDSNIHIDLSIHDLPKEFENLSIDGYNSIKQYITGYLEGRLEEAIESAIKNMHYII